MAGGTWLVVRDGEAAIALLNRRDPQGFHATGGLRSRGLLAIDVATAPREPGPRPPAAAPVEDGLARSALRRAWTAIGEARYAPFTLVFASAHACWAMAHDGHGVPEVTAVPAGWSVLTHGDLNDPGEPRTAYLLRRLAGFHPDTRDEAEEGLAGALRSHGENGTPPVCLHEGGMVTVSSSLIWIEENAARYRHADGRPCEGPYGDLTSLLAPAVHPGGGT